MRFIGIKQAVFVIAALLIAVTAAPAPALASDSREIVTGEDPEDAVKGHVYIRAVVEKGYRPMIDVELIPASEEGAVHTYTLSEENGYGISDDIMVGEYGCICYPDITETWKSDATAIYEGHEQEVTEGGDTCFVVVAGSPDFTEKYSWMSYYRDEDGGTLSGYLSRSEARALEENLYIRQDAEEEVPEEEHEDNPPEEYEDPGVPAEEEQPEEPSVQLEEDGNVTAITAVMIKAAAAALVVLVLGTFIARIVKRFRKN